MKFIKPFLFVLLALIIGVALAVYRIAGFESNDAFFHNGSWIGSKHLPLGKDNLLTAQVSCFALFALPSEEAIYLFAKRDEQQHKFHSKNDYTITGNIYQIHANYWSITAYGKDLFLIPNRAERYSFNNSTIKTDSAGNFSIAVSSKEKPGNWLPAPDDAQFGLVLRIYKGEKDFIEQLDTTALPEIKIAQP